MQQEYEAIKKIFKNQIRLSPFNPNKPINILTDGASSSGIGFVFYQPTDISTQEVTIVQANSSALKKSQMAYCPVDTEVLALKFACDASQHYLYRAEVIHIYTDCSALEGMFNKPLSEIKNRRIRNMIEKPMGFDFKFHHIPGVENKIADCLSRLTRRIPATEHFSFAESTLGNYDKIKTI